MLLGSLSVSGRLTELENSMGMVYCTCSRCRWELLNTHTHTYTQQQQQAIVSHLILTVGVNEAYTVWSSDFSLHV